MAELVILRHGQSVANQDHIFTGWSDVELTSQGIDEAKQAAQLIAETGILFEMAHTSMLKRAIMTANITLEGIHQLYLPLQKSWRLNERHYGALRGLNKDQVAEKVGAAQVKEWRRSFTAVPPALKSVHQDRRYDQFGPHVEPAAESLEMAYHRLLPYWLDQVVPRLLDDKNQIIIAHGSTLRALIKYLEQVNDDDIAKVEVPNGQPIHYSFDRQLNITDKVFLKN